MVKNLILVILSVFTVMFFNGCSNIDELTSALNSIKDNATNSSGNNNTSLTEEQITVWFDTQQSSIPNWSIFIDNGSLIPEPENPVLENYTFLGWYDNNVNGNLWNFNTPCTKDITVYAMWEKVNTEGSDNSENQSTVFTITYDNKGFGEDLEPLSLMGNTTIYESAVPTLYAEGYIFQGWYYNAKQVISGQLILTEHITFTANWLKKDDTDKTGPADVTDL